MTRTDFGKMLWARRNALRLGNREKAAQIIASAVGGEWSENWLRLIETGGRTSGLRQVEVEALAKGLQLDIDELRSQVKEAGL